MQRQSFQHALKALDFARVRDGWYDGSAETLDQSAAQKPLWVYGEALGAVLEEQRKIIPGVDLVKRGLVEGAYMCLKGIHERR